MALSHFRMFINGFFNNGTYIVPEETPITILYGKSALFMANNRQDTKHTRHIAIILHFVVNAEKYKLHNID